MMRTASSPYTRNLIGQSFGRWTVEAFVGAKSPNSGHIYWSCRCECGRTQDVRGTKLLNNHSMQCERCNRKEGARSGRLKRMLPDGQASYNELRSQYCRNARKRNLPFALSDKELRRLFTSICYYCGAPPASIWKGATAFVYNGLDRIDNTLGYIPDNVVPCCTTCNFAKREMSRVDFISWVERVYLRQFQL